MIRRWTMKQFNSNGVEAEFGGHKQRGAAPRKRIKNCSGQSRFAYYVTDQLAEKPSRYLHQRWPVSALFAWKLTSRRSRSSFTCISRQSV